MRRLFEALSSMEIEGIVPKASARPFPAASGAPREDFARNGQTILAQEGQGGLFSTKLSLSTSGDVWVSPASGSEEANPTLDPTDVWTLSLFEDDSTPAAESQTSPPAAPAVEPAPEETPEDSPVSEGAPKAQQDEHMLPADIFPVGVPGGISFVLALEPSPDAAAANGTAAAAAPVAELAFPDSAPRVTVNPSAESRLVALAGGDNLGAEKFRALAARLEDQRRRSALKSFQVTSSVAGEGKTVVSANVAVTLAKHARANTLLVEGDLHRPALAAMLGLATLRGLSHWWSGSEETLSNFVYRVNGLPLWFLPAGAACEHASNLLRSRRFQRAFGELVREFSWAVVDSTPMEPDVDADLWTRLLDGTLLVVREGVTPVKAMKHGLQTLDQPNIVGIVVNDAARMNSPLDRKA